MNDVVYNIEVLNDELRREITPILEEHRLELSRYEDMILNPDWKMYNAMQENNKLRIYTARDRFTDVLLGYTVFFLIDNPHYCDFLYAHQDVFYVVQNKRGTRIAYNLIKKSEEQLKEDGVTIIVHHTKLINKFGQMLDKLGYSQAEIMYHKRIDL